MSQPLTEANLKDQMCDIYDAGQLLHHKLRTGRLRTRYMQLYENRLVTTTSAMQEALLANRRILTRAGYASRREFLAVPRNFNWKRYVERTIAALSAILQQI